jgi:hypothetical protein
MSGHKVGERTRKVHQIWLGILVLMLLAKVIWEHFELSAENIAALLMVGIFLSLILWSLRARG